MALTKKTKGSVFESDAENTAAGKADDADAGDPYKEKIPPAKKQKRKRHKVAVSGPLETCRDCDMASCSTRIPDNWCCSVAPDLPQFSSDEDEEDDNPEDAEPEEEEEEEGDLPEVNRTDTHTH